MAGVYEVSEEFKYPDPVANNAALTNHAQTGLLWRDALASSEVKVLSASQFTGKFLGIDNNGNIAWISMALTGQGITAFGEVSVAQSEPSVQVSFRTGLIQPEIHEKYEINSGTVTFPDKDQVSVNMAAVAASEAWVQSRSQLRYRPGQGSIARYTAVFASPIANTQQLVGQANGAGGFFFGYNGTSFGIVTANGGLRQIIKFVVTTASNGNTNATITLDGVGFTVPLTDASPEATFQLAYTAWEIGKYNYGSAWIAEVHNDTVYFISTVSKVYAGAFSFSHATAAVTQSTVQTGVAATETWVAQASWNGEDILDGNGPSGVTLDPTKGNVYQIRYQWLGYGLIQFSLENAEEAEFQVVHTVRYPNTFTSPSISNPNMHNRLWVRSTSGTPSGALTAKTACFFGAIEGRKFRALGQAKYSVSHNLQNNAANVERPMLVIRNNYMFNERFSDNEVVLWFISVASDSNKPHTIRIRKNCVLGAGTIDQSPTLIQDFPRFLPVADLESTVSYDTQAETLVDGGTLLMTFELGKTESRTVDVSGLNIVLRHGDTITVTSQTTNGTNDVTVSLSWDEEHG